MIDYNRISNRDYLNGELESIGNTDDTRSLSDELKVLSQKLHDKSIDPNDAKEILSAIRNRQNEITGNRKEERLSNAKVLKMSPTAVSNRAGAINIALLIASIATTTIMYIFLVAAELIK